MGQANMTNSRPPRCHIGEFKNRNTECLIGPVSIALIHASMVKNIIWKNKLQEKLNDDSGDALCLCQVMGEYWTEQMQRDF